MLTSCVVEINRVTRFISSIFISCTHYTHEYVYRGMVTSSVVAMESELLELLEYFIQKYLQYLI